MKRMVAAEKSHTRVAEVSPRRDPFPHYSKALLITLLLALVVSEQISAQTLEGEPRFGTASLSAGFAPDPHLLELVPGGTDYVSDLPDECLGYINEAQPDYRVNFQSGSNPLSIFVNSSEDTTLLVNDPQGNWHCNDDSSYLSDANPGVQIQTPSSGDYQIWVGTYDQEAAPIYTILALTEQAQNQWTSLDLGIEDTVLAMSLDSDGNIVFGDDSGFFTLDNECDDPRFQGPGAAFGSSASEMFKDATDCRTQFEAGSITLAEAGTMFSEDSMTMFGDDMPSFNMEETATPPALQALSSLWDAIRTAPGLNSDSSGFDNDNDSGLLIEYIGNEDIDFGDNSSIFANDGECDDPRFEGAGMAAFTEPENEMRDANDCIGLLMEGALTVINSETADAPDQDFSIADDSGIDFGDNSSMFADDGECDDPRFEGQGPFALLAEGNIGHDANDCREAFLAGSITYIGDSGELNLDSFGEAAFSQAVPVAQTPAPVAEPAVSPQVANVSNGPSGNIDGASRSDGSIFASGSVYGDPLGVGERNPTLNSINMPAQSIRPARNNVNFGDNTSTWADDGECDDPRFEGVGMAAVLFDEDAMHDANDCRSLFQSGSISLK